MLIPNWILLSLCYNNLPLKSLLESLHWKDRLGRQCFILVISSDSTSYIPVERQLTYTIHVLIVHFDVHLILRDHMHGMYMDSPNPHV